MKTHYKTLAIDRLPCGDFHVTLLHKPKRWLVAGTGRTKAAAWRRAAACADKRWDRAEDRVPLLVNRGPFWGCV